MMVPRYALILFVAFLAVSRTAICDLPADDPFKLHLPPGMQSPSTNKDLKAGYIPEDLDGCFAELDKMLSKAEIQKMKAGPEEQIDRYYYSFGDEKVEVISQFDQHLCDRWQLYSESRLAAWFKARGIDDADDMGDIIVHSFWRRLNEKPIELDAQIKAHQVYIPKDLDDCLAELEKRLPKETVARMKNSPEKDMVRYHHGLGTWLRNKWGLWKDSRLAKWFKDKGVQHPDDMSGIILHSFWRHLNDKPLKLDEQIKHYQDYWKKVQEERSARERKDGKSP